MTARCGWWKSGISGEIRTHADTTPDYPKGPRKQTTCEREMSERRARAAREQRGSSRASRWCLSLTKARASRRRAERRNKGRKWDTPPRGSGAGQSGTSTPIVLLLSRLNSLRVKRESRFDLPTPESPINTTTAPWTHPGHRAARAQPPRRGNETLASEASSERHAAATSNRLVETAPSATNMCGGQGVAKGRRGSASSVCANTVWQRRFNAVGMRNAMVRQPMAAQSASRRPVHAGYVVCSTGVHAIQKSMHSTSPTRYNSRRWP